MKLHISAFALTCGVLWAVGVFAATWWVIALDGSSTAPTLLSRFYRGYSFTPAGSLVGLVWGLVDGLIGGAIFAWLYNLLVARLAR